MTINMQLSKFLESKETNKWLDDDILAVYVRKSTRLLCGERVSFLDIANIREIAPEYLGKGYFKSFITHAEQTGENIYVENVLSPTLRDMLRKHGYAPTHDSLFKLSSERAAQDI